MEVRECDVLVMGVGNLLMGDEGVGVHAVRALDASLLPPNVRLLDGGTGGFHLLPYLQDYPVVIIIDATMDQRLPGTVRVLEPKFASDFPKVLSAHDIGLKDLVESAALLGKLPKIYLITISVADIQNMEINLSESVKAALPMVQREVTKILAGL